MSAVAVAHELVHELDERIGQQHLVVADEQVNRCFGEQRRGHRPPRLAMKGHDRPAVTLLQDGAHHVGDAPPPRTSWARSTRQPSAMPRAWRAPGGLGAIVDVRCASRPRNRLFDADRNTG